MKTLKKISNTIFKKNFSNHDIDEMNPYEEKLHLYKMRLLSDDFYERKWQSLKSKFTRINLYGIGMEAVGESMPRLMRMVNDLYENKLDKLEMHVVLPLFPETYKGGVFNERALEIFNQYVCIIDDSNIDFWMYTLKRHKTEINVNSFNRYKFREPGYIETKLGRPLIELSSALLTEGEKKFKQLGIKGDFVCIHAREEKEKRLNYGEEYARETVISNCDINSIQKACLYLHQESMQTVRMGKFECDKCTIPGIIDYANQYYDELMDFYLLQNCKFMIACNSGLWVLPGYLGRPYIMINTVGMNTGWESCVFMEQNMYLPKKFWSEEKERYLNLYEVLDVVDECHIYFSKYKKKKISLIDDTEDEIYEAVVEMNSRLDGTWTESLEEKECMEKYKMIIDKWYKEHAFSKERRKYGMKGYTMNNARISWTYLKNNMYLLEI
ncbi:MAG: TIGR04372 family glycosyltransferase [Lachnospiraceae bacterium]|nr:TIGR04372 family glycosyltransferase [Lachnospiraceae bacterium]